MHKSKQEFSLFLRINKDLMQLLEEAQEVRQLSHPGMRVTKAGLIRDVLVPALQKIIKAVDRQ